MTYVFDIDDTICVTTDADYANAIPLEDRIVKVNKLYDEGHTIFFLTARGMGSSDNDQIAAYAKLYKLTDDQLKSWGLKYHRLFLGKPSGDIFVDDKGCKDHDFFAD